MVSSVHPHTPHAYPHIPTGYMSRPLHPALTVLPGQVPEDGCVCTRPNVAVHLVDAPGCVPMRVGLPALGLANNSPCGG